MAKIIAILGLAAGVLVLLPRLYLRIFKRSFAVVGVPPFWLSMVVVVVAILVIGFLLWKVPIWQVAGSEGLKSTNRFDRENEARKTLAQIIAGVLVLAGLYSSVKTLDLSRQSQDLLREGQITDRFSKAIEQLGAQDAQGNPKIEVRIGGIYALERIARDSQRDHIVIMEVLTAYVRKNAFRPLNIQDVIRQLNERLPKEVSCPGAADIQAILTVIGRRKASFDAEPLDLSGTNLTCLHLSRANLGRANLLGADLSRADLRGADLKDANLGNADLGLADLSRADLSEARLLNANLSYASLTYANLSGANLLGASLLNANLSGAQLNDARNLTQQQIDQAMGDSSTKLPTDLKPHDRWPK